MLRSVVAVISLASLDRFMVRRRQIALARLDSRYESEVSALDPGSITKHLPSTAQRPALPPPHCSPSHLMAIELRTVMEDVRELLIFCASSTVGNLLSQCKTLSRIGSALN